jgi:hypothetical protein
MTDRAQLAARAEIPLTALDIAAEVLTQLSTRMRISPVEAARLLIPSDARAASWNVRLRVVDSDGEVIADTDDERPHEAPGADVVHGLTEVAQWAAPILRAFHGTLQPEQTLLAFTSRIPSLRTALCRSGTGRATWPVPYEVNGRRYIARVDVVKSIPSRGAIRRATALDASWTAP